MNSGMILGLLIIFGSLLIGGIIVSVILTTLRSHRVRVRDPLNFGRQYITDFWVSEKIDKLTKERTWASVWFFPRFKCERPPDQAIDVGKRGRMFAEGYKVSEGEIVWITDNGLKFKEIVDEATKKKSKEIVGVNREGKQVTIDTLEPFNKTQRRDIISQFQKAELMNRNRWTPERILQLASIGMMGLIIIIGIIFAGDVFSNLKNYQQQIGSNLQIQREITENQAALQVALGEKVKGIDVVIAQRVGEEEGNPGIVVEEEEPPTE